MSKEIFKVNDYVVYPAHGVGKVTNIEEQVVGGQDVSVYVIAFDKDKMLLHVPVRRAERVGLRGLSTEDQVKKAVKTLKGRAKMSRGMWSRRAQEYEQKINSGNIVQIAEVVRDLHKNVDDPDRSYSERMIYESALERLAGEYAVVANLDAKAASSELITALKGSKRTKPEEVVEDEAVAA